MQELNDFLLWIDSGIGSHVWFVYFLLGTGVFFTVYMRFPQIRYFRHALKIVKGKFDKKDDEGDTSHFQALTTALSGTVGTGNIAGVAFAIHLGGPAALFWMLVTAFLGMTTKFVEVTLSHKYREKDVKGEMAGGPMYFMKNKLNMKWLALIFAFATILSSFGTGSLPQINNIATSLNAVFGFDQMVVGAILSVLLGVVIIGGITRIAAVTEKLVPLMAVIYFIGAFAVIFYNIENIIPSFVSVFTHVFTGTAATGGFLGAGFAYAFNRGVNRGLFSNEAGQGSAPIAHAAAKASEPVSEGMVAILEPFIDTIVICLVTGLVLLSSGVWDKKYQNDFQYSDMQILAKTYDEDNASHKQLLYSHLSGGEKLHVLGEDEDNEPMLEMLTVKNGEVVNDLTIIHARSIAEEVKVYFLETGAEKEVLFSGKIKVEKGRVVITDEDKGTYIFKGKSLIHSAPLTIKAFQVSYFGESGKYIVSIGLLLFAFSTAISWSYYGDRAMTFIWGAKSIIYFRIVYVLAFFFASFADTTIIWTLSGITIALMTVPNLVGILMLRKDMKDTTEKYWIDFKKEYPNEKTPD